MRRLVDGLEPARAEPVQLDTTGGLGHPRRDGSHLGDVGTLVADRRDAAEHDVVDHCWVDLGKSAPNLVEQHHDEIDRLHLVQRAVLLAPAAGRANGLEDPGLGRGSGCGHTGDFPFRTTKLPASIPVTVRAFLATLITLP